MDIDDIVRKFNEDIDVESENRAEAQDDIAFGRLGIQWPAEVVKQRQLEGRPCLTINRMPSFLRQVINDAKMNTPQIKIQPVDTDADIDTAKIYAGLIKNIEICSNSDVVYDTALEYAVSCGMGFIRIGTDYTSDDEFTQNITMKRVVNPLSVVFDSHGESIDGSDWNHVTVVDYISKEEYKKRFKVGKKGDKDIKGFAGDDSASGDKDTSDMIRIAEHYCVENEGYTLLMLSNGVVISEDEYLAVNPEFGVPPKVMFDSMGVTVARQRKAQKRKVEQYICGADILEENDWPSRYLPIIPVFGEEVYHDGKRHLKSLFRDAKDSQRMLNYWRTASTELVALAPRNPYIGPTGAFDSDSEKWKTANTRSYAYLEYDGAVPPQRQLFTGPPAGAIQEALNASDDMKSIMGLFDAALGARSNETSGRAIIARQKEGDVSTFHFIDNHAKSIAQVGRVLVDMIPRIYDTARVVRIVGEDKKAQNIQLKQPTEFDGKEKIFDLSVGKYDVVVETGPSFTTQRAEVAMQMTELIRNYPKAAPFIGDLLAKNLGWPDSEEISRRMQAMLPPHLQVGKDDMDKLPPAAMNQINGMKQQMQQMSEFIKKNMEEFQQTKAENEKLKLQNEAIKTDKEIDFKKLEIDKYNAETNRIKAQIAVGDSVSGAIVSAAQYSNGQQPM